MAARVELLVTYSGADSARPGFANNVWVVGNDEECVVIDAAHDAPAIAAAVGKRRVVAILLTHGHWDHVGAAPALRGLVDAPVWLHPADLPLWSVTNPDTLPDGELTDSLVLTVAGTRLEVRHTPGHTPGASVVVAPELGVVFSGDTLFHGGPGATRWEYSDFAQIIDSISSRLLTLPAETVVHTGHGEDTTVGAEAPDLAEWVVRGW